MNKPGEWQASQSMTRLLAANEELSRSEASIAELEAEVLRLKPYEQVADELAEAAKCVNFKSWPRSYGQAGDYGNCRWCGKRYFHAESCPVALIPAAIAKHAKLKGKP